tara:strand:- start:74 stop:481 length:408 start_codon:yes stop_codon:yes gene_type:complete
MTTSTITTFESNGKTYNVQGETPATYKQISAVGRMCAGIFPGQSEKPTTEQWSQARKNAGAIAKYHADLGKPMTKAEAQKYFDTPKPKLPAAIAKLVIKDEPKKPKAKKALKIEDLDMAEMIKLLKAQGLDVVKS